MHRRAWLRWAGVAAVVTVFGRVGFERCRPEELVSLLETLAGDALCETCLARHLELPALQLRHVVRRIGRVLVLEAARPCEHCGIERTVYAVPRPARRPLRLSGREGSLA